MNLMKWLGSWLKYWLMAYHKLGKTKDETTAILQRSSTQTGKDKQLSGAGETVYVTNLFKYYSAVDVTDTQNGHDDRIMELHNLCHLSLHTVHVQLAIK